MTSKLIIAVGIIVIILVALAFFSKKSVRAELVVQADPEQVWAVITNPGSYKDWNPILVSVDGEFVEGRKLSVGMKNPDGSITAVTSKVVKIVPDAELNQFGGMPGVLTFDHTWKLEAVEGGTRVIQFEEYRGIGVLLWDPAWVEKAYRQANLNLRDLLAAN